MLRFLVRRLLGALAVLLAVSFFTFVMLELAPGDAADTLVGETASAEQMAAIRSSMGLDLPLLVRYSNFLTAAVFEGDLGRSVISGRSVGTLVAERFKYTFVLAVTAMSVAVAVGGLAGAVAAARPRGWFDLL
ncbi:MAG: ABC transporter permease, partial [Chloroflexia bacterium]|nr:ABC transporter permease [Chloroflexia bacterium]